MKTAEQIKEAGRLRARKHYEKHKEAVKAKNKAQYHAKKAEMDEQVRQSVAERYKVQLQQAKCGGLSVTVPNTTEYPYGQCAFCNHYSNLVVQRVITPESVLVKRSHCGWCGKNVDRVECVLLK